MSGVRRLPELFGGCYQAPDVPVSGLSVDSREVRPGDVFCALAGSQGHGIAHWDQARARGAVAMAYEPAAGVMAPADDVSFAVPGLRASLGEIAARYYDHPSEAMELIGVTGTNGKSSVTWLAAQAHPGGAVMGTLGWGRTDNLKPARLTTPDAITVQKQLRELADAGCKMVAMEASSHAIEQGRVGGCRFAGVAVTNVTRDHLDYHRTMEAYAGAKARLFAVDGLRFAIINADAEWMEPFMEAARGRTRLIRVSSREPADVHAETIRLDPRGVTFKLLCGDTAFGVETALLGRFNVDNLLTVAAIFTGLGWAPDQIAGVLPRLTPPRGRMTRLKAAGKPTVVVDYAHTPDALESALQALRDHGFASVTCVFGCGGDRDAGKRPLMGLAAARWSDRIVVTDDNPRSEDGDAIVADILPALKGHADVRVERRRDAAIASAIATTAAGGVVLVAGKGHEDYQEIGGERQPFDDIAVASSELGVAA